MESFSKQTSKNRHDKKDNGLNGKISSYTTTITERDVGLTLDVSFRVDEVKII